MEAHGNSRRGEEEADSPLVFTMTQKKPTKTKSIGPVRVGDEVRVRLYDHVKFSESLHEYFVYGRVAKIGELSIVLDAWAQVDPADPVRTQGEEIDSFCLIRSAITEIVILTSKKQR